MCVAKVLQLRGGGWGRDGISAYYEEVFLRFVFVQHGGEGGIYDCNLIGRSDETLSKKIQ